MPLQSYSSFDTQRNEAELLGKVDSQPEFGNEKIGKSGVKNRLNLPSIQGRQILHSLRCLLP